MNYSNIVLVGDSMTNERQHYKDAGILDIFKERNYEFKEYGEFLSEHYGCPYETFGEPGMTLPFTMMTLIDKVDYILSLENPLIIYQFGVFFNATLKIDDENSVLWKDFNDAYTGKEMILDQTSSFSDSMDIDEKLAVVNWFSKYEEYRNYWYIEEFITLAKMLNRIKPIDIFGMPFSKPKFKIPRSRFLLNMWNRGCASDTEHLQPICYHFPDINDGHKTTIANENLSKEIIKQIDFQKNII